MQNVRDRALDTHGFRKTKYNAKTKKKYKWRNLHVSLSNCKFEIDRFFFQRKTNVDEKKNRLRVKFAALKSKRFYISLSRKYAKESESDSHH